MATARKILFKSAFKVENTDLEINLCPKPLFSGDSDSSYLERERWKTMTVVVEWQRPLAQKTYISRVECLIKMDPKMTYA